MTEKERILNEYNKRMGIASAEQQAYDTGVPQPAPAFVPDTSESDAAAEKKRKAAEAVAKQKQLADAISQKQEQAKQQALGTLGKGREVIASAKAGAPADVSTQLTGTQIGRGSIGNVLAGQTTGINRADIQNVAAGNVTAFDRSQVQNVAAGSVADRTASTLDQTQSGQSRGIQMTLADQLAAQARGEGPSIAQMQAQQQGERALATQLAMQAGQTGAQAVLGRRTAQRNQAQIGSDIANQSAILRLQEQQGAQAALGTLGGQIRGQDVDVAGRNAALASAMTQANLGKDVSMAGQGLQARLANQAADVTSQSALQAASQADVANALRANLANQAADQTVLTANQAAEVANADRKMSADLANQGVDLAVLKQNAASKDAASLASMKAALQQQGMNNDMIKSYMTAELGISSQEADVLTGAATLGAQTALSLEQIRSNQNINQANLDEKRYATDMKYKAGIDAAARGDRNKAISFLGTAAGAILAGPIGGAIAKKVFE